MPKARSLSAKLREKTEFGYGWNAQTNEFGDLYAQGVIDPVKVVRTALQDAASVAGLPITTEAMVAEAEEGCTAPADAGRWHGLLTAMINPRPDGARPSGKPVNKRWSAPESARRFDIGRVLVWQQPQWAISASTQPSLADVLEDVTPARAGLRAGDVIVAVNRRPSWP